MRFALLVSLLFTSVFADRYSDFLANKQTWTNNEAVASQSTGMRRICAEIGYASSCTAGVGTWNMIRSVDYSSSNQVSYAGTMTKFVQYYTIISGQSYDQFLVDGTTPPAGWSQGLSFWVITDSSTWAETFGTGSAKHTIRRAALFKSSIHGAALIVPYGDSNPGPYYTFVSEFTGYYLSG